MQYKKKSNSIVRQTVAIIALLAVVALLPRRKSKKTYSPIFSTRLFQFAFGQGDRKLPLGHASSFFSSARNMLELCRPQKQERQWLWSRRVHKPSFFARLLNFVSGKQAKAPLPRAKALLLSIKNRLGLRMAHRQTKRWMLFKKTEPPPVWLRLLRFVISVIWIVDWSKALVDITYCIQVTYGISFVLSMCILLYFRCGIDETYLQDNRSGRPGLCHDNGSAQVVPSAPSPRRRSRIRRPPVSANGKLTRSNS